MKLTILYGESVSSWRYTRTIGDNYFEMAPSSHQISISNAFAPGWEKIGGDGTWYMGCCWIEGLCELTREQLINILEPLSKALGKDVYGTTVDNTVRNVEKKLNKLMNYIVSNSPIILKDVSWRWGALGKFRRRVQTMLKEESKLMVAESN